MPYVAEAWASVSVRSVPRRKRSRNTFCGTVSVVNEVLADVKEYLVMPYFP